jgi:hypothetical protein
MFTNSVFRLLGKAAKEGSEMSEERTIEELIEYIEDWEASEQEAKERYAREYEEECGRRHDLQEE